MTKGLLCVLRHCLHVRYFVFPVVSVSDRFLSHIHPKALIWRGTSEYCFRKLCSFLRRQICGQTHNLHCAKALNKCKSHSMPSLNHIKFSVAARKPQWSAAYQNFNLRGLFCNISAWIKRLFLDESESYCYVGCP